MTIQTRTVSLKAISKSPRSIDTGTVSNIATLLKKSTGKIQEEMMGRNENQTKNLHDSNITPLRLRDTLDIVLVHNALSTSICTFGVKNSKFIKDTFRYFADKCGYKASNHFYSVFSMRPGYDVKLKDLRVIYRETKDPKVLEAINNYLTMEEN